MTLKYYMIKLLKPLSRTRCIQLIYYYRKLILRKIQEKPRKFGNENPDYTYYIIHRNEKYVGLFSNVLVFIEQIDYAIKKGYIPVIDMKNYNNSYLYKDEIGVINAWEYYFEQPFSFMDANRYSLETAYNSQNVILNNGEVLDTMHFMDPLFLQEGLNLRYWQNIYKKYIRINKKSQEYIDIQYNKLIHDEDRVLGVFCRGTDYRSLRPYGHPIQPDINDVLSKTATALKEWNCNKLFISTEDYDIYTIFKNHFGEIVIANEREYVENIGNSLVTQITHHRNDDKYLQGLEYLTSLVILSKCNCIIASSTSGVAGTVLMNEGFEQTYFYNLGYYGIDDVTK